jgi:tetratricopeptide (TPR) repeat protein
VPSQTSFRSALLLLVTAIFSAPAAHAQSSSSSTSGNVQNSRSAPTTRIAQPEAGGSAITLETSEPLFYIATALNACGYDTDLAASAPIRATIRAEVNEALAASAEARDARDALCAYIQLHTLADSGRNLAQYVSLAVYLKPPPELTPIADETELPPDSTQVVNVLPLLRTFAEDIHLNAIWINHRAQYEDLVNRVHDPLTKMVLNTNIYLGLPVSSYDGRRFLVLLEPMLAPSATNARIYSNDFLVVSSPAGEPLGAVHMDQIRHTYLHYEVEPLIYARASAMDRLQPLLKSVQDAPIEFAYKSDIVALITECLIKAIEARTMDTGLVKPKRPVGTKARADLDRYDAENTAYERQAEAIRRKTVQQDVLHGWVLVEYLYNKLGQMEKDNISLKEDIGEMVYGMDVQRELHTALQITFLPNTNRDDVIRAPRQLKGMDLAEMKLLKGDTDGAEDLADSALKANPNDARAHYLAGRIELMHGTPEDALDHFNKTLTLTKDPRTLAWTHIYLGRLYDIARDPKDPEARNAERPKAIAEYKAALAVRDALPDTKAAAEKGLKEPFALPKREQQQPDANTSIDPSGKAEKDAYRPPPPTTTIKPR